MQNTILECALHLVPKSNFTLSNTSELSLASVARPLEPTMPTYEKDSVLEGAEVCDERHGNDVEEGEEEEEEEDGDEGEEDEDDDLYSTESSVRSQLYSPKKPDLLGVQENFHFPPDKEKQISVDPLSLKHQPPVLPPLIKPKFFSSSLPCSTTSSPQFSSSLPKSFKKWINPIQKPHPAVHFLARHHSVALSQYAQQHHQGMFLRRSKSCGDGRSSQPSDDFDIMSRRPSININQPQTRVHVIYDRSSKDSEETHALQCEEEFKCGALCLFLPAFSKKKQEQVQVQLQAGPDKKEEEEEEDRSMVSRVASLEKFECGSWSSSAILDGNEAEHEGVNSYFDLPLELIRGGGDDAHSPVKTAFVFDGDRKGVLKKSTSRSGPRKSHESSNRHVRFSTSAPMSYPPSPTSVCITPRLLKAREEFNALLEAQSTCINF